MVPNFDRLWFKLYNDEWYDVGMVEEGRVKVCGMLRLLTDKGESKMLSVSEIEIKEKSMDINLREVIPGDIYTASPELRFLNGALQQKWMCIQGPSAGLFEWKDVPAISKCPLCGQEFACKQSIRSTTLTFMSPVVYHQCSGKKD